MRAPTSVTGRLTHQVTGRDSATSWGNDVPVLATPILLWLSEVTAMQAIEQYLEPDEMTVGLAHESRHLAPTPVGMRVRLTATLIEQRGHKLVFEVRGHDDDDLVLEGRHTRAVVHRSTFLSTVDAKTVSPARGVRS
jgi:fluoroacetyl-CoA thioesterase